MGWVSGQSAPAPWTAASISAPESRASVTVAPGICRTDHHARPRRAEIVRRLPLGRTLRPLRGAADAVLHDRSRGGVAPPYRARRVAQPALVAADRHRRPAGRPGTRPGAPIHPRHRPERAGKARPPRRLRPERPRAAEPAASAPCRPRHGSRRRTPVTAQRTAQTRKGVGFTIPFPSGKVGPKRRPKQEYANPPQPPNIPAARAAFSAPCRSAAPSLR